MALVRKPRGEPARTAGFVPRQARVVARHRDTMRKKTGRARRRMCPKRKQSTTDLRNGRHKVQRRAGNPRWPGHCCCLGNSNVTSGAQTLQATAGDTPAALSSDEGCGFGGVAQARPRGARGLRLAASTGRANARTIGAGVPATAGTERARQFDEPAPVRYRTTDARGARGVTQPGNENRITRDRRRKIVLFPVFLAGCRVEHPSRSPLQVVHCIQPVNNLLRQGGIISR